MAKPSVTGYVGPDAIPIFSGEHERSSIMISLKYYLEDRIENQFDVNANLSLADAGAFHISVHDADSRVSYRGIMEFVEGCIQDFLRSQV